MSFWGKWNSHEPLIIVDNWNFKQSNKTKNWTTTTKKKNWQLVYNQAVKGSTGRPKSNIIFVTKKRLKSFDLTLTTAWTMQKGLLMLDRNGIGGNTRFKLTRYSPTTLDAQMFGRKSSPALSSILCRFASSVLKASACTFLLRLTSCPSSLRVIKLVEWKCW